MLFDTPDLVMVLVKLVNYDLARKACIPGSEPKIVGPGSTVGALRAYRSFPVEDPMLPSRIRKAAQSSPR